MTDTAVPVPTDDAYAVLRASHPLLATLNKDNFAQFFVLVTVWMRKLELGREDAIFRDPFIVPLAQSVGEALFKFFPALAADQDLANYVNLRAYCGDQALDHHDPAIRQVVIIANGLDTRAFRSPAIANCTVFEIHLNAAIMDHKEQVFADLGVETTARKRTVLFAHFHDDHWQDLLLKAGFDPRKPTYWILESTLHFIRQDEVVPLLSGIDFLSGPHSQLFTEGFLGGGLDLDLDEDRQVALTIHAGLRYGEDAGIFRGLAWDVELLLRRDADHEYYGTMWDPKLLDRFRVTGDDASSGAWFIVLFTKPE